MSHSHQPSGLRGRIEFLIDPGWSPEQAFAVVELLDDLRNRIWAHYAIALSEEYRNQFAPVSGVEPMVSPDTDDPPF
jgi:hypothetical protein